jgi:FG-GAP-like repeat
MTTTPRLVRPFTPVNTTDNGVFQGDGQIVGLNSGGYVIVWTDSSHVYSTGDAVIGQRFDAAGNMVGGEVKISRFLNGDDSVSDGSSITLLPNGNIAVTYTDSFSGQRDTYVRIVDPSLALVRDDNIETSGLLTFDSSITSFADGSYAVSYTVDFGGVDSDVVFKIVSSDGNVGAPIWVKDNGTLAAGHSQLATLSNNNFVDVFQETAATFGGSQDIRFSIYTSAGAPVLTDQLVVGGGSTANETDPDVAALVGGGFVVAWTDAAGDDGFEGVRASIYNNAGTLVAGDILINTTTAGIQRSPTLVGLGDGGFVATWVEAGFDRGQRFDALGHKIGVEYVVKTEPNADNLDSALLSDGRFAYAVDNRPSLADTDVMTSIWRARDVSHDFDGDGKSGVLWRHDSGQVYFWEMDGLGIKNEGGVAHAPVPSDWHIQGAGDFDGDGNNDVLWRHDSGQVYFWEMNGLQIKAEGGVAHAPVPNDWHVQGTGDFDADGKSDILWRQDSGQVYFWEMDGLAIKAEGGVAHAPVPNDWHIQGIGDFNGDGKSDLLWRQDGGQVYFWEMDGLQIKAEGAPAHAIVPNDWHIEGLGDFNGDSKSDILWRHDSGQVYFWEMDGLQIKAEGAAAHALVPNDWHIQDIGDYNADGKSDILWRHDSGQVYLWEMNGLQIAAEGGVSHAAVPSDWHIFSQQNFV